MHQESKLLTIREAADFLHVSENTVRMWVWQKRIPSIKLGRSVRLQRSDLEQLIHDNRRKAIETVALRRPASSADRAMNCSCSIAQERS